MQVELNISNSSLTSTRKRSPAVLLAIGLGSLLLVATLYVANVGSVSNPNRTLLEYRAKVHHSAAPHQDTLVSSTKTIQELEKELAGSISSSSTSTKNTGTTTTGTTSTGTKTTTTGTTSTGSTKTGTTTTGTSNTGTTSTGSTKTGTTSTGTTTTGTTGTGTTTTTGSTKTGTTSTGTTGTGTTSTGSTTTGSTSTGTPTTGTTSTPTVDPSVMTYQTGQKCTNGLTAYLSGLNDAQKAEILKVHNTYRSQIALGQVAGQPGATDMLEMVWDDEMATHAQAWADHCVFDHDSDAGMATSKFTSVGQNLDIYMSSGKLKTLSLSDMVKDWYDEVLLYNGKSAPVSSYVYDDGTGHYTQVAWAKSYALGCGFKVYMDGGMYSYQLTCNYGPGGNYEGEKIYTAGTFNASKCKYGASTTYQGLCKASA